MATWYNQNNGLVDIDATQVLTVELVAETLSSFSGTLDCTSTSLSNVGTINGVNVSTLSNVAHGASNVANVTSQNLASTSNLLFPKVTFSSNLAIANSNAIVSQSNAVWPVVVYGSNVSTGTSNVLFASLNSTTGALSNLRANFVTQTVTASNLDVTQGVIRVSGSNFLGTDRKIDYNTWIKNGPTFSNDNTLSAAGLTIGTLGLLSSLGGQLLNNAGGIGPSVAADIGKKLGEEITDEAWDPTQDEDNIQVHWNSVLYPPIHKNLNSHEVAFSSNVHVNSNAKLYSIRSDSLVKVDGGRYKRIDSAPSRQVVIDFAERKFFGTDFSACNVSASNTIQATDFLGQNATITNTLGANDLQATNVAATGYVVAPKYKTNSLVLTDSGLFAGDPSVNPLTAVQVIDAFGNYKGTITKDQVLGNESLDWGKLNDGIMSLQGSSSTYVNPFGIAQENAFFAI